MMWNEKFRFAEWKGKAGWCFCKFLRKQYIVKHQNDDFERSDESAQAQKSRCKGRTDQHEPAITTYLSPVGPTWHSRWGWVYHIS